MDEEEKKGNKGNQMRASEQASERDRERRKEIKSGERKLENK